MEINLDELSKEEIEQIKNQIDQLKKKKYDNNVVEDMEKIAAITSSSVFSDIRILKFENKYIYAIPFSKNNENYVFHFSIYVDLESDDGPLLEQENFEFKNDLKSIMNFVFPGFTEETWGYFNTQIYYQENYDSIKNFSKTTYEIMEKMNDIIEILKKYEVSERIKILKNLYDSEYLFNHSKQIDDLKETNFYYKD